MKHYIITIFAMLALSVGSASCSEDEPLQGTGQQTTPNNGNNNSGNNLSLIHISEPTRRS